MYHHMENAYDNSQKVHKPLRTGFFGANDPYVYFATGGQPVDMSSFRRVPKKVECVSDTGCPLGLKCRDRRCEEIRCKTDSGCSSGKCDNNPITTARNGAFCQLNLCKKHGDCEYGRCMTEKLADKDGYHYCGYPNDPFTKRLAKIIPGFYYNGSD